MDRWIGIFRRFAVQCTLLVQVYSDGLLYITCISIFRRFAEHTTCTKIFRRSDVHTTCTNIFRRFAVHTTGTNIFRRSAVHTTCTNIFRRSTVHTTCTNIFRRSAVHTTGTNIFFSLTTMHSNTMAIKFGHGFYPFSEKFNSKLYHQKVFFPQCKSYPGKRISLNDFSIGLSTNDWFFFVQVYIFLYQR